jgi:hypothetical protein
MKSQFFSIFLGQAKHLLPLKVTQTCIQWLPVTTYNLYTSVSKQLGIISLSSALGGTSANITRRSCATTP